MKNLFIAAFLFLSYNMIAQSIQCPTDQIVNLFDLDQDYDSYGTPITSGPGSYEVAQSLTTIDNSCQGNYGIVTTITYELVDVATNTSVASCDQVISVQRPLISDFIFPQEFTIAEATLEELIPDLTGNLEPVEFLGGSSNFISAYSDQVINSGSGVRILRTWTILDWCTANTNEETQIIRVTTLAFNGSGPLSVNTCTTSDIEADNVVITTDTPNFIIDYGTCPNSTNNITEFVNCVAAINDIPSTNSFTVEIEKDTDALNGVSTLDLVLIQRHILGQARFDNNGCKIIAADVTNDNNITALDLLELRKLILGIYSSFPQSTSWRFINAGLLDPLNPFSNDLKFNKSEFPLTDLQIIGIKVGDVNDSASGN